MHVQRMDPAKFIDGYDIKCQMLYPWEGVVEPPFGAAWAVIAPGQRTKHHNHQEGETFLVVRGHGIMRVDDEVVELKPGDVVFHDPFHSHTMENPSDSEELVFLSIWWEDTKMWAGRKDAAAPAVRAERVMVTAAPPTPNGDLHLGHLAGPYLAGDVHTRYLRLRGVDAHYAFGTDDNQSYVQLNAGRSGLAPQASADQLAGEIAKTLKAAGIELDLYSRPNSSATHVPLVQAFFRRLWEEGKLIEKEAPSPWCEKCERYLFEAHVRGLCPHCGTMTGGNGCENCGRPNDCVDLADATCVHCGSRAGQRTFKRLYFPLGRYQRQLKEYYLKVGMKTHLRTLCERVLAAGTPDIAVTHVADWGIPVPVPGYEGQVIYAWFEMAPRYLSYSHDLNKKLGSGEDWSRFWKSEEAEVVQCFGFDNGFFYAMLIPALLLAFDPEIRLPAGLVMNEFYHLDGQKFSTSRRHAIWGRELTAEVPADVVRFYLAWDNPETENTNFTRAAFAATVERELVGSWQTWLAELGEKVASERGGEVPWTGDWTEEHRRFYQRIEELTVQAATAYEARTFSPQLAVRTMSELVRTARRFAKGEEHWRGVPSRSEERRTSIALELMAAKVLAVMAAPVMPELAARLWHDLGYDTPFADARWEDRPTWVPGGQKLRGLGGPYFDSLEQDAAEPALAAIAAG